MHSAHADLRPDGSDSEEDDEYDADPGAWDSGGNRPRPRIKRFNSEDLRESIRDEERRESKVEFGDYTDVEARKIAERQRRKMSVAEREAVLGLGAVYPSCCAAAGTVCWG